MAPGTDVRVLFPGESQVLGSHPRSSELPGQKSKFTCQYCNLPMAVGDVAIFCERAGADKVAMFYVPLFMVYSASTTVYIAELGN